MDFFEVAEKRRSYRIFKTEVFPDSFVERALDAALIAPNSSNTQTWDFYWVRNPNKKARLVEACLAQSAARTASHLIVVTANPKGWKRSQENLIKWVQDSKAHKSVVIYYEKIVPFVYRWGPLNIFAPLKWLISFSVGLFRPMVRGPYSKRDVQEVAIKSAALAAENLVLAITAQGGATCMMEGFDEWRVKRLLKLSQSTRVVMVIAIGFPDEKGLWGPQYRLPKEDVVHVVD